MTHLETLELHLSNERIRLTNAKDVLELAARQVWVKQLEKEVAGEREFLGLNTDVFELTDADLLEELGI